MKIEKSLFLVVVLGIFSIILLLCLNGEPNYDLNFDNSAEFNIGYLDGDTLATISLPRNTVFSARLYNSDGTDRDSYVKVSDEFDAFHESQMKLHLDGKNLTYIRANFNYNTASAVSVSYSFSLEKINYENTYIVNEFEISYEINNGNINSYINLNEELKLLVDISIDARKISNKKVEQLFDDIYSNIKTNVQGTNDSNNNIIDDNEDILENENQKNELKTMVCTKKEDSSSLEYFYWSNPKTVPYTIITEWTILFENGKCTKLTVKQQDKYDEEYRDYYYYLKNKLSDNFKSFDDNNLTISIEFGDGYDATDGTEDEFHGLTLDESRNKAERYKYNCEVIN